MATSVMNSVLLKNNYGKSNFDKSIHDKYMSPTGRSNLNQHRGDMSAMTAPSSRYLANLEGDVFADSFYSSENEDQQMDSSALLFDDILYSRDAQLRQFASSI
eukprot:CAMPEP_0116872780 /NCGR_PEP_ID=MMETSP0463-20121206/3641_1 /TAXON_ID=181622 /ORGANISM="Strombidinopsis sp, Strain SopsisLIS2011" /LENGTH=102 /DNA_ID=CAMNT_0004513565 /DNA_START=1155 /DNA_END=1463 /DNA_ORIENTATION=+